MSTVLGDEGSCMFEGRGKSSEKECENEAEGRLLEGEEKQVRVEDDGVEDRCTGQDGGREDSRHGRDLEVLGQEVERHDDQADDQGPREEVRRPEALEDQRDFLEEV